MLLSRFSRVQLFVTPWTVAHQVPLSTWFSRQEYWGGLPCPPPGDLLDPAIEPMSSLMSPAMAGRFFTTLSFSHSVISYSFETPWAAAEKASLSFTNSRSLLKLMSLSRWCYQTISSSVVPFSAGLQSFPASESFLMSQLFTSGGLSIRASASASVLPMNIHGWFPYGLVIWSPCIPRDSQESSLAP